MTTDYRALCAELLHAWRVGDDIAGPVNRARTALAQPEPEGVTDEEIDDWHSRCADLTRRGAADHHWAFDLQSDEVAGVVRAALTRYARPTIQPVPVSERLPTMGADELDDQGTCWNYHPVNLHYCLCVPDPSVHTHWLPHHALPTP
jgi:hypothetical protein